MIGAIALLAAGAATLPTLLPDFTVNEDDYPPFARRYQHTGVVGFTVQVDAAGVPHDCTVTSSSTFAELDAKSCEIIEARMRFLPAHDDNGKLIANAYANRIRWQLDERTPVPFRNVTMVKTMTIASDGSITNCAIQDTGSVGKELGFTCDSKEEAATLPYLLGSPLTAFTEATILLRVRVGGSISALEDGEFGSRKFSLAAHFTVNALGRIENCASTDNVVLFNHPFDICAMITAAQTDTAPAFAPSESHRGSFGFFVYGRMRPAAAEHR